MSARKGPCRRVLNAQLEVGMNCCLRCMVDQSPAVSNLTLVFTKLSILGFTQRFLSNKWVSLVLWYKVASGDWIIVDFNVCLG